jgi:hypothetical protein
MEVSGGRCPDPAPPTASRALLLRDDPEGAALSRARAAQRFRVAGVNEVEDYDTLPGRATFITALRF